MSSPCSLPSESIISSHSFASASTEMAEMLLGPTQEKEYYDMKTVLEELRDTHEQVVVEKDGEILATKVQLAFCTEVLTQTKIELESATQNCLSLALELKVGREELESKADELSQAQFELETTNESLRAAKTIIVSQLKALEERDEKIASIEHTTALAKRSAQAFVGFLTLGALFTEDK